MLSARISAIFIIIFSTDQSRFNEILYFSYHFLIKPWNLTSWYRFQSFKLCSHSRLSLSALISPSLFVVGGEKETNSTQIDFFFYWVGSGVYGPGRVIVNGESQFTKRNLQIYSYGFEIGLDRGIWAEQKRIGRVVKIFYICGWFFHELGSTGGNR